MHEVQVDHVLDEKKSKTSPSKHIILFFFSRMEIDYMTNISVGNFQVRKPSKETMMTCFFELVSR